MGISPILPHFRCSYSRPDRFVDVEIFRLNITYYLYYSMAKDMRTVRDVDEAIWRKFRAKTEEEGLKTGQALNEALREWVEDSEEEAKKQDPNQFHKERGMLRQKR